MSSSVHIDNKGKEILIFGDGPTQGLDYTTLTTEAKCSINFSQSNRNFIYVCIIMGATALYLLIAQKYTNSKLKLKILR